MQDGILKSISNLKLCHSPKFLYTNMPGENLVVILQIHPKIQLAVLTVQKYCPDLLHWRVSSLRRPGRNIWPT
jgi:hypothetical protein